jgi:hypothetical protein
MKMMKGRSVRMIKMMKKTRKRKIKPKKMISDIKYYIIE